VSSAFVDTNVLYNILFKTSLTEKARKTLEELEDRRFYTSLTVVNELLYITTRKYYESMGEAKGPYSLRNIITDKGYPKLIIDGIQRILEDLEVEILVEYVDYKELIDTAIRFKLLPSDAIIALTCRHHNIDVILTFDTDFERVPWLRILP
jgi:predicted nucleic acid-binding protein